MPDIYRKGPKNIRHQGTEKIKIQISFLLFSGKSLN